MASISQDIASTYYTTPSRKQYTPVQNPYIRKPKSSKDSSTALVPPLRSRIINSPPAINSQVERTTFAASLFSIDSSNDSVFDELSVSRDDDLDDVQLLNDDENKIDDGQIFDEHDKTSSKNDNGNSLDGCNMYNFIVSPFGCYCSICKVPVGTDSVYLNTLRSHNHRSKKK